MDYNQYATAINKIFECINMMKYAWPNPTNVGNIEKIEEYKNVIIQKSQELQVQQGISNATMEELGE